MPVSSPTSLPSETEGDPHRGLVVHADYFHGRIDYKAFRAKNGDYPVVASDPLVLEPLSGSYAVLTRFGGLVFWSCPHDVQQELREAVAALPGAGERSEAVSDVIEVLVGERRDRVGFDRVAVRKLTKEKVKVISMALAQSVALEHFENRVSEALHQSEPIVARLRAKGRLSQSETEIIQAVGFALEVRSAVLAKLTLFDDPP